MTSPVLVPLWHRWSQHSEVTSGDWLPDQPVPLFLAQPSAQRWRRLELSREEVLKLWNEKRQQGWRACPPQWALPSEPQPRDGSAASNMSRAVSPPCC